MSVCVSLMGEEAHISVSAQKQPVFFFFIIVTSSDCSHKSQKQVS